jgi:molybdenum cofactor biosynthesis protein B
MPIDESIAFAPVHVALLTVSDTRTRTEDVSGDTLEARVKQAGLVVAACALLRDDCAAIAAQLKQWIADPRIGPATWSASCPDCPNDKPDGLLR